MLKKFVFLGGPGVGKGTFSNLLKEKFNIIHICAGDLLRNEIKKQTEHGIEINNIIKNGNLVPDSLLINLIINELDNNNVRENGFILDGFPRKLSQAQWLSSYIDIDKIINIRLKNEIAIGKLLGRRSCNICKKSFNQYGFIDDKYYMPAIKPDYNNCKENNYDCPDKLNRRFDDTEDIIKTRLIVHENEIKPIINFYETNPLYHNKFHHFDVYKGIDDLDKLIKLLEI